MKLTLINLASFYIGWFACVIAAGQGHPLIGPVIVAVLLGFHFFLLSDTSREARLIIGVGILGSTLDTLLMWSGLYSFPGHSMAWLCPLWITALWMIFATTLHTSLRWLAGRYALAAILGAVGGPLSYYAGARFGALTLYPHPTLTLATITIVWAIVMPVLIWLARPAPFRMYLGERAA
ncbi:MAG: DUF2878 domain-containing protein [Candidatus Binatia bacterium]